MKKIVVPAGICTEIVKKVEENGNTWVFDLAHKMVKGGINSIYICASKLSQMGILVRVRHGLYRFNSEDGMLMTDTKGNLYFVSK